jgi:hypothetical protein
VEAATPAFIAAILDVSTLATARPFHKLALLNINHPAGVTPARASEASMRGRTQQYTPSGIQKGSFGI